MSGRDIYIVVAVGSFLGFLCFIALNAFGTFRALGAPWWINIVLPFGLLLAPSVAGLFIRCAGCDLPIHLTLFRMGSFQWTQATLWAPRTCSRCGANWVDEAS